jgi:2-oxoglutarate dehydrogenase E2 component (dihydrolipoamide succinyltransferase)
MAELTDLVVPPLGESITEAVVGRWLKKVGEEVAQDEPLVDLETDKITVQLPAPAAGVLREQRVAQGDTVQIGDVVGQIEAGAGARAAPPAEPAQAAQAEPRREAEPQAQAAPPAEPRAEAAAPARPEPEPRGREADADTVRRLSPARRRAARLGSHAAEIAPDRAEHAERAEPAERPQRAAAPDSGQAPRARAPEPAVARPAPEPGRAREDVVVMSSLRRRIAQRLVQAQHESASLTTFNEVDMSAVMAMRNRHKQAFQDTHGVKLGFMSFFAKACVAACQRFPGLNAEIRDDAIVYKKHYDFGVAVSTERGLVVPVLRDVDRLSFADIEQGIMDLAIKARDAKLTLDDLTGGTFTITNGGIFGSMLSTPLLNYPQTGILGMHNIVNRPVAVGDRVEVRPVMYVALTYDHRVVDGREAVQFLVAVKERIEQPESLLLDL